MHHRIAFLLYENLIVSFELKSSTLDSGCKQLTSVRKHLKFIRFTRPLLPKVTQAEKMVDLGSWLDIVQRVTELQLSQVIFKAGWTFQWNTCLLGIYAPVYNTSPILHSVSHKSGHSWVSPINYIANLDYYGIISLAYDQFPHSKWVDICLHFPMKSLRKEFLGDNNLGSTDHNKIAK